MADAGVSVRASDYVAPGRVAAFLSFRIGDVAIPIDIFLGSGRRRLSFNLRALATLLPHPGTLSVECLSLPSFEEHLVTTTVCSVRGSRCWVVSDFYSKAEPIQPRWPSYRQITVTAIGLPRDFPCIGKTKYTGIRSFFFTRPSN